MENEGKLKVGGLYYAYGWKNKIFQCKLDTSLKNKHRTNFNYYYVLIPKTNFGYALNFDINGKNSYYGYGVTELTKLHHAFYE